MFNYADDLSDALAATQIDTLVFKENPNEGWEAFVLPKNVNAAQIKQRIATKDIFDIGTTEDHTPFEEGGVPPRHGYNVAEGAFLF